MKAWKPIFAINAIIGPLSHFSLWGPFMILDLLQRTSFQHISLKETVITIQKK
jgi:hypothetical protein